MAHPAQMKTLLTLSVSIFAAATLAAQSSKIPTPESVVGFAAGAEHKLATYDQTIDYFKKLDAASDQMVLVEAGTSTQGRTFYFALISSKDNLKKIDRYREIARRLARPEGLTEAQALALAREGKPLVHIDGGLHSTEVAGPQHTLLLAHDLLAKSSDPQVARILDNVILMLWPTINPDGHQMVADWYMKNIGTANETLPRLYQEYVGHDNNRDAYMLNMIESRVVEHTWRQWEPQVIYVQHQSSPFPTRIWLPPFAEPIATHAPFLMSREVNTIGMAIAQGLEEKGQVGATHMGTGYDAWYAGYIDYTPMFKNIASFWTETALAGMANTREYKIDAFPREYKDLRPQALYTSPWAPGKWTLRDAVDYMYTASLSVLDYAARYKENVLLNRYRSGKWQIEKHRKEGPFAYVIPQDQRDKATAVEMLRRLAFGGIRVASLTAPLTIDGETFPTGTWVIPADQEFIALAREVLDPQVYPDLREFDGGPPEQPYDAAGWTLPMTMGVRVVTVTKPIADADRAKFKMLAADTAVTERPTPYVAAKTDAAAFDSVPGAGFNTHPMAAAIVPARGRDHRNRIARRDRSRGNKCVQGAEYGVEGERPGEPRRQSLCDQRRQRRDRHRDRDLACDSRRARRHGGAGDQAAAPGAVRAAEQHGCRLDEVGARTLRLRVHERHDARLHRQPPRAIRRYRCRRRTPRHPARRRIRQARGDDAIRGR